MRISDWSSDVCSSDLGWKGLEGFRSRPLRRSRTPWLGQGQTAGFDVAYIVRCQTTPFCPMEGSSTSHAFVSGNKVTRERPVRLRKSRPAFAPATSEERRVGKEGVRTGRPRGGPYH